MLDPFHPQGGLRSCEYSINAHCLTLERVVYEVPLVFLDNYALFKHASRNEDQPIAVNPTSNEDAFN